MSVCAYRPEVGVFLSCCPSSIPRQGLLLNLGLTNLHKSSLPVCSPVLRLQAGHDYLAFLRFTGDGDLVTGGKHSVLNHLPSPVPSVYFQGLSFHAMRIFSLLEWLS